MQRNRSLLCFLSVFLLSFGTIWATNYTQNVFVERGENYNLTHTFDIEFAEKAVLSDADVIILTQTTNGTDIFISYAIPAQADYTQLHKINITTKDSTGAVIESVEYFLYIFNLTNDEQAHLVNTIEDLKDEKDVLVETNEGLEENLTRLFPYDIPQTGWDQYGGSTTTIIITACITIVCLTIPAIVLVEKYRRNRNLERAKKIFEIEQRKKSEMNRISSDLNLNPQRAMWDGKTKYYTDLLGPQEKVACKQLSKSLDAGYFLTPLKEWTTGKNKEVRKATSLDRLKYILNTNDKFSKNYLKQKYIIVSILKFLNYKGWKNGIGELKDRDPLLVECTSKEIEDYCAAVDNLKEEQLGGIKEKETEEYDKFGKDLFEDYQMVKDENSEIEEEIKHENFESFIDGVRRV